jgi:predicted AlkP superfamily pyrophosphatase or phosphodiesterase
VSQPVHLNQRLRSAGFLQVRDELGLELLDAGASQAFAVADHQLAHVYINDPSVFEQVKILLEKTPGVAKVLDEDGKQEHHLNHERSGELVVIAEPQAWFTYYYWLDDAKAPDFARTVDIHRKPGYDPVELFFDAQIRFPKLKIAKTLLKRRLGMRSLMDLTPLNANLVRGSHGHLPSSLNDCPMVITQRSEILQNASISAVEVCSLILSHLH